MINTPPNEVRNFIHRRVIGAASSFVSSGFNPLSAGLTFLRGGGRSGAKARKFPGVKSQGPSASRALVRTPTARTLTARPGPRSAAEQARGREIKFASLGVEGSRPSIRPQFSVPPIFGKCIPPFFDDGQGGCEIDLVPGPGGGGTGPRRDIGETIMGRYGAGEVPGNQPIDRAVCRRGMVLGNDGICYNRSQISNKERAWPRGRRPLLTGGDMRAISTAARAGKRLEGATKRLQKIGLMKKPTRRPTAAQIHHAK